MQTCKFLEYNAVNSFGGSCYRFIPILHETFITMKIIIRCYDNQTKTTAKTKHWENGDNMQILWVVANLSTFCMNFGATLLVCMNFQCVICPNYKIKICKFKLYLEKW